MRDYFKMSLLIRNENQDVRSIRGQSVIFEVRLPILNATEVCNIQPLRVLSQYKAGPSKHAGMT